jgi:hypothetical protein
MMNDLKNSRVEPVTVKFAADYIRKYNYTGNMTGWTKYAFGHFFGERCGGVNVFGVPTGRYTVRFPNKKVLQLRRGISLPGTPHNSGSFLTASALRWLQKNTDVDVVVAFANPRDDEYGTIYQASNWSYLGISKTGTTFLIDEIRVHPRVLNDRHGTRDIDTLRRIYGDRLTIVPNSQKFRYAYSLRKEYVIPSLPYPRREKS